MIINTLSNIYFIVNKTLKNILDMNIPKHMILNIMSFHLFL